MIEEGDPMTTETLTLTDFLLARIAEDEEDALAAAQNRVPGPWRTDDEPRHHGLVYTGTGDHEGDIVMWDEGGHLGRGGRRHIARHDPARVLAECEAKRRIVGLAMPVPMASGANGVGAEPTSQGFLPGLREAITAARWKGVAAQADAAEAVAAELVRAVIAREHAMDGATNDAGADGWFRAMDHTLRFLALPYADHPDYDESWRP